MKLCDLLVIICLTPIFVRNPHGAPCSPSTMVGTDQVNYYNVGDFYTYGYTIQFGQVHYNEKFGQAVVAYDTEYVFPCCGMVTEWHVWVYEEAESSYYYTTNDRCPVNCPIDFMVWRDKTPPTYSSIADLPATATLVGLNTIIVSAGGYTELTVPITDYITVKTGDFIGWQSGPQQAVDFWEELTGGDCAFNGIPCTTKYMTTDWSTQLPDTIPGKKYSDFLLSGEAAQVDMTPRWFAITAVVQPGTAPKFRNIDKRVEISADNAPVNTVVHTVVASDPDVSQTLTYSITGETPAGPYFNINPNNGDVYVSKSLHLSTGDHTLTIAVSDGCLSATDVLVISVAALSTSSIILITIACVAALVALATSIALAVLCYRNKCKCPPKNPTHASPKQPMQQPHHMSKPMHEIPTKPPQSNPPNMQPYEPQQPKPSLRKQPTPVEVVEIREHPPPYRNPHRNWDVIYLQ